MLLPRVEFPLLWSQKSKVRESEAALTSPRHWRDSLNTLAGVLFRNTGFWESQPC